VDLCVGNGRAGRFGGVKTDGYEKYC